MSKQEVIAQQAKPVTTIARDESGVLRRAFRAGKISMKPRAARVIAKGTIG
jgi:hypothetical protein